MTKRDKEVRNQLRELQDNGWNLNNPGRVPKNHIAYNDGMETTTHRVLKAIAGGVLVDKGFRVAGEVSHEQRGEIDVVGYGHESRQPIAVEVEHSPSEDVIRDKLSRYVDATPIREMFVVDPDAHALPVMQSYEQIKHELGL